jgi:hypothetical protein
MTVGLQIAVILEMPLWLESLELISLEQWLAFTQYLNFTAIIGLH